MPSHPDEQQVISGTFGDQIRSAMRPILNEVVRLPSGRSPRDRLASG